MGFTTNQSRRRTNNKHAAAKKPPAILFLTIQNTISNKLNAKTYGLMSVIERQQWNKSPVKKMTQISDARQQQQENRLLIYNIVG